MSEKKQHIFLRDIPQRQWIKYQYIAKLQGISAVESIRRHIAETVKKQEEK